ncbi:MAG: phage integrase SAM-like domain-containing protein [Rikenellaceae bacterium]
MFTINIKGKENPKSPELVKLEMVFFKSGYPRVTKIINISGPIKEWDQSTQQFKGRGTEVTERNKRLLEIRTKYLKIAEAWDLDGAAWSPVQWSHFFDKEQQRREEEKVISVSQMFDILDDRLRKRERIKNGKVVSSAGTANTYKTFRHSLEGFTKNKYNRNLSSYYFCDLTEEFVDEYTFYLQKRGAENGHNGNVRNYLRLFTGLVYYAPRMANVPDADLRIFERVRPKMKSTQFNPRTIPLDVVEKIKNIDRSLFTRLEKFHIDLFLFTYYTGMANVDVCYLTWDCIDDEGILRYERTKYPKTAILPFVDKAREIADRYKDKCYGNYVMPVLSHKHITEHQMRIRMRDVRYGVNRTLRKVAKVVRYKDKITWYAARGAFITKCILEEFRPDEVAEMAGNSYQTIFKNYFKDTSKTKRDRQYLALNK